MVPLPVRLNLVLLSGLPVVYQNRFRFFKNPFIAGWRRNITVVPSPFRQFTIVSIQFPDKFLRRWNEVDLITVEVFFITVLFFLYSKHQPSLFNPSKYTKCISISLFLVIPNQLHPVFIPVCVKCLFVDDLFL